MSAEAFGDPIDQQLPAFRTERGVSVQPHPVLPWFWRPREPPASKEDRMNNVLRNYRDRRVPAAALPAWKQQRPTVSGHDLA